jgi:hypothetical protein
MIADYQTGMSIRDVQNKWSRWPKRPVSMLLHQSGVVRARDDRRADDPSPEEIEHLRDITKASWSAQEAGSRWVGRRSTRYQEAGRALSKLLPN